MHTLEAKDYDIFASSGENSKMEIFSNGKMEQILIGSGASANIVSKQVCKILNITSLKPTKKKLYPYGFKEPLNFKVNLMQRSVMLKENNALGYILCC